MIRVANLAAAEAIPDPEIRQLAMQRIAELAEQGFSLSEIGEIWMVEDIDALADIEKRLGGPVSAYELIENSPSSFAVTYVLDQAGMGFVLLVPKTVDIPELLAMCLKGAS